VAGSGAGNFKADAAQQNEQRAGSGEGDVAAAEGVGQGVG
jgi:hypothetical protein